MRGSSSATAILTEGFITVPRYGDQDFRPGTRIRTQAYQSIMSFDNSSSNGQAQSSALSFGSEERLEQLLASLPRQSPAVIAQGELQSRLAVMHYLGPVCADLHRTVACRQGVLQYPAEDLPHGQAVHPADEVQTIGRLLELVSPALVQGAQLSPGFAQQLSQITTFAFEDDRSRVTPHLLVEMVQMIEPLLDIGRQALDFRPVSFFQGEQFQASLALLERIATFVGQACHRFSYDCQTLRLPQFSFNLAALGDLQA